MLPFLCHKAVRIKPHSRPRSKKQRKQQTNITALFIHHGANIPPLLLCRATGGATIGATKSCTCNCTCNEKLHRQLHRRQNCTGYLTESPRILALRSNLSVPFRSIRPWRIQWCHWFYGCVCSLWLVYGFHHKIITGMADCHHANP